MKTLVLDGTPEGDSFGTLVGSALETLLRKRGDAVELAVLRDMSFNHCRGCFHCWMKSPGICVSADDNRDISRKFIGCDLVIFLTPVTFGAYSPELKQPIDHLIQNISPFFCKVAGETHHRKRYGHYPDLLVIGWLDAPAADEEEVFSHLVDRNALNFNAKRAVSGVLYRSLQAEKLFGKLEMLLEKLDHPGDGGLHLLPRFSIVHDKGSALRKAVLLIGSPRLEKSTSASLGNWLFGRLAEHGVETATFSVYRALRSDRMMQELLDALDKADLTVLSFPLYIDSLPAPLLSALRMIHERRRSSVSKGRFVAMANSGFIESDHNATALASCALFAGMSGFEWAGSVSIGGGEGLIRQLPLEQLGGPVIPYKKALKEVADALAEGGSVPEDVRKRLASNFVPAWIFRIAAGMSWKKQARFNGTLGRLDERPYEVVPKPDCYVGPDKS